MKKDKNISARIKAFVETSAPKVKELKYGDENNEFVVKVYPMLKFSRRMEMVREIVDGVFMEGRNSVKAYIPEYLTLLQKYVVVKNFTDIQLPDKLDDLWLLLNYTAIYDDVVNAVGSEDINDIFDAANKAIDTYRQYLATKTDISSFMDKIGGVLSDFEGKVSKDDIAEITSKIKNVPAGSTLQSIIGSIFSNKDVNVNK